ncbi:hypothetical protein BKA70DRAFT_1229732 [Coprinopsis sp. MPI-PUGE-AT-0042]|nr:hypothetical protein BKA70DRAFT_1229732 [Coprinopsis sp. MPI-PUGE-AT-0042]
MPPLTRTDTIYSDDSQVNDWPHEANFDAPRGEQSDLPALIDVDAAGPTIDNDVNRAALFFMNTRGRISPVITLFQGHAPGKLDLVSHVMACKDSTDFPTRSRSPLSPEGSTPATLLSKDSYDGPRGWQSRRRNVDQNHIRRHSILKRANSYPM